MKQFYSNLIDTEYLSVELDRMDLTKEQRMHLLSLIESNIHHTIIELVLSELSEEDKKTFLEHVALEKHDKVWELLNDKVDNIEDKIRSAANSLAKELHKDIKEVQNEKD